ncbi:MAG: TetR/AcrR family transcriptional regulator [Agathobacter sp.]|nr:TetR/AcrR family transcriptional regulator [Agathobacter sp.]
MDSPSKREQILDALNELLQCQDLNNISVSDIAQKAGIGKGSIYYYFESKDAIVDALIERTYKTPLETAKALVMQTDLSPFERMAMIFKACQKSSKEFLQNRRNMYENALSQSAQEQAYIHHKYLKYLIAELKPSLTEIIKQELDEGLIHFDYPEELAEIVLIVLTVKLDNSITPSSPEEVENCIRALILLLENGTGTPSGALDYLKNI